MPVPLELQVSSSIHAAIIDLDGTMVDTMGDFELALNLMLADLGYPSVQRSFIERTVGKGSEHLVQSTLHYLQNKQFSDVDIDKFAIKKEANGLLQLPDVHLPEAMQSYQAHYLRVNGQASKVYDGVIEGLSQLHSAGLPLACLTNKPTAFAVPLLKAKGLDGFFSHVFGGDAFERKKPDPLPLLKTCEALGTLPARTLMVGDSSNDAQAAHAAGCPVALVTYGYNHGEPIRATPADTHLGSMAELAGWIGA
jgi:phosphoglycolate phosphatase